MMLSSLSYRWVIIFSPATDKKSQSQVFVLLSFEISVFVKCLSFWKNITKASGYLFFIKEKEG
jgi:hypothetical protein